MRVEILKYLRIALMLVFFGGCAGNSGSPSSVLEPVNETPPAASPVAEPPAPPKAHERLAQQLSALGYEAVGMEFEDPSTIAFLEKVFASPQAQNLDVKRVYTGMRMQHDKVQKSVTIGGTTKLPVVMAFLKKVPKRKASAPAPVLKPVAKPATARPSLPKVAKPMAPRGMAPPPPPMPTVAPTPEPDTEPKLELTPEPTPEPSPDPEIDPPPPAQEPEAPSAESENPAIDSAPPAPESSN